MLYYYICQQKQQKKRKIPTISSFGGVERVRTSAPLSRPNCLANNPLHHLGTTPLFNILNVRHSISNVLAERVGFEPTVGSTPTPIFKTGALNQLDHLSMYCYVFP